MKRTAMPQRSTPLRRSTGVATASVPVFRPKRCKACTEQFTPTRQMQKVCGRSCAERLVKAQAERERARTAQADRKATKQKLAALKPRSQWLKEAQAAFNAYIRARDEAAGLPCISCDRHHQGSWDAGHYLTVGARPELRFDEANVHRQCVPCNQHLHGNLVLYRIGLVKRLGSAEVERLEGPHDPKHYSIDDIKAIKATYRAKTKALTARPTAHQVRSLLTMCPDCLAAAEKPRHGFHSSCKGCAARAVSRGLNYWQAVRSGTQHRAYREELAALEVTHDQVKQAAAADAVKVAAG